MNAPWLPKALAAVDVISKLPSNWDSYKADPPTSDVVKTAEQLLTDLAKDPKLPRPYVNPTRNGGVQLEWESEYRYFEIEVHTHLGPHFLYTNAWSKFEETGCYMEGDRLDTIIDYIYRVYA